MPWIWKVLSLFVLTVLAHKTAATMRVGWRSKISMFVPIIIVFATWYALIGSSSAAWLSEKWSIELDPISEINGSKFAVTVLGLFVFGSLIHFAWRIHEWTTVRSDARTVLVLRTQSILRTTPDEAALARTMADSLSRVEALVSSELQVSIEVFLTSEAKSPHLIGFTRSSLRAVVSARSLENPEGAAQILIKDFRQKGYLIRPLLFAILLSPLCLVPIAEELTREKVEDGSHGLEFRAFANLGLIGVTATLSALSIRFLPGPPHLDVIKSGTSRSSQTGWQLLQSDPETRFWTTSRGGRLRGAEVKGLIVDTRESKSRFVRIYPGPSQRVGNKDVVSYSMSVNVHGHGSLAPILCTFATPRPHQIPISDEVSYRQYNESESKFILLEPGIHTYRFTHRGQGELVSDFQLRVPPGWVVELFGMRETVPDPPSADPRSEQLKSLAVWRDWNEAAIKGIIPRASLTWKVREMRGE